VKSFFIKSAHLQWQFTKELELAPIFLKAITYQLQLDILLKKEIITSGFIMTVKAMP
jgi:hypothetical protein